MLLHIRTKLNGKPDEERRTEKENRMRTSSITGSVGYQMRNNEIKKIYINPLNAELNPTCHLPALLGAHPILHVSRISVNSLDLEIKTHNESRKL